MKRELLEKLLHTAMYLGIQKEIEHVNNINDAMEEIMNLEKRLLDKNDDYSGLDHEHS